MQVPAALAAYRATEHESTGFTPNQMLFGREVNLPLDLAFGVDLEESERSDSHDHYVSALQDRLRQAYAIARKALAKSVTRNKRAYDLRSRPKQYEEGQWVWYYYPRRYVGRSPKFQRLFTGPYLIIKLLGPVNVVLKKGPKANPFVTHVDKLKLCHGPTPRDWRKEESSGVEAAPEDILQGVSGLDWAGAAGDDEGPIVRQGPATSTEAGVAGMDGGPWPGQCEGAQSGDGEGPTVLLSSGERDDEEASEVDESPNLPAAQRSGERGAGAAEEGTRSEGARGDGNRGGGDIGTVWEDEYGVGLGDGRRPRRRVQKPARFCE